METYCHACRFSTCRFSVVVVGDVNPALAVAVEPVRSVVSSVSSVDKRSVVSNGVTVEVDEGEPRLAEAQAARSPPLSIILRFPVLF